MLLSLVVALSSLHLATAQNYDYIVVGSGPGGGPLAANLARAGYSTLLLEAGTDQGDNVNITSMANSLTLLNDPKVSWEFFVNHTSDPARELRYEHLVWETPDGTHYVGLDPPEGSTELGVWYPRAGTLGGCATHNAGLAILPANADWDDTAALVGNDSWTSANMRQYLVKLERNLYLPNGTAGHGFNGYLEISQDNYSWPAVSDAQTMAKLAVQAYGDDPNTLQEHVERDINSLDPNLDSEVGVFGLSAHYDYQGIRSTHIQYIRATAANYPLTVQTNSLATKVLFDNTTLSDANGPKAIGVEFLRGESMYSADPRYDASNQGTIGQAFAAKEVILAGGVFNSPQLLKLSGIGPAAELEQFDIPVLVDKPGVGHRMTDNYEASFLALAARDLNGTTSWLAQFFRSSQAPTEAHDLFFFCGLFGFEGFYPGPLTNYGPRAYDCSLVHMRTNNRNGSVLLKSSNPRDTPAINFEYFQTDGDRDLEAMLEGVTFAREKIVQQTPANMQPWTEVHPCTNNTIASNQTTTSCTAEAQKEEINLQAWSHHATGTCAIGPDSDPMAVLDSQFRVRGTRGLRVVDGSAFPVQPGSFPVLPTYMIGEKAFADIVSEA